MDVAEQMLKQDADNRLWKINHPEKAAQVRIHLFPIMTIYVMILWYTLVWMKSKNGLKKADKNQNLIFKYLKKKSAEVS